MQHSFQEEALREIKKIVENLKKQGFLVSEPIRKTYNYEIKVNSGDEQIKSLIYFGKNGVKKVVQGNESLYLYRIVKNIVAGLSLPDKVKSTEINFDSYIGTDESGKGDYFGPLVVSAVFVNNDTSKELETLGVKDSKLLSDFQIKNLEEKILKLINKKYDTVVINPEKYNDLYKSFKNLNKLLGWAHSKAIENLTEKSNCFNVISDKFGNEEIIKNELKRKKVIVNLYQTPKAERYTGVAAASILARSRVIDWFESKSKEIGFHLPKGGGEVVNLTAKRILKHFNEDYLLKIIKFHFRNSQNIFKK